MMDLMWLQVNLSEPGADELFMYLFINQEKQKIK